MKLSNLFEATVLPSSKLNMLNMLNKIFSDVLKDGIADKDHDIQDWWRQHIRVKDGNKLYDIYDLTVKDGLLYYKGKILQLDCEELKYPIGFVKELNFGGGKLISVKNFPDKPDVVYRIHAGGESLQKIDHPIVCNELRLARNQITSLKNIHKFVKCEKITIWNNPIKDSILGLLMIPGIKEIDDGSNAVLIAERSKLGRKPNEAIKIVSKYVGKGKQGILDAQNELMENDMDDYAES